MTAAVPLVERLAEALRGGWDDADALDAAQALLPVVEQAVAEARGEALREAADALFDHDHRPPGCSGIFWLLNRDGIAANLRMKQWLRDRADAIEETP